jgi:hypothetical protein
MEHECLQGETHTLGQRVSIHSIPVQAKRFSTRCGEYWSVELPLHWRLDVVFEDDTSRIRKGHVPAMMTSIPHLCMNLFGQEASSMSLAKKRRKAAWNDDTALRSSFHTKLYELAEQINIEQVYDIYLLKPICS